MFIIIVWINLNNDKQGKEFGFKFIIPHMFPRTCPIAFLDEPVDPLYPDIFDYIKAGNILDFFFIHEWKVTQH